jgi:beta-lactam-binding protein with PASTA domain
VTDPAQLGLVVSTTPLATEYVGRGTTVTLVVGQ